MIGSLCFLCWIRMLLSIRTIASILCEKWLAERQTDSSEFCRSVVKWGLHFRCLDSSIFGILWCLRKKRSDITWEHKAITIQIERIVLKSKAFSQYLFFVDVLLNRRSHGYHASSESLFGIFNCQFHTPILQRCYASSSSYLAWFCRI